MLNATIKVILLFGLGMMAREACLEMPLWFSVPWFGAMLLAAILTCQLDGPFEN